MIGKMLVCLHVGMSVILATWAGMQLYLDINQWPPKKNPPPDGIDAEVTSLMASPPDAEQKRAMVVYGLVEPMKEFKKAAVDIVPNDVRMREASVRLYKEEKGRPEDRIFFARQLEFLRTGTVDVLNAVQQIERGKGGVLTPLPVSLALGGMFSAQLGGLAAPHEQMAAAERYQLGKVRDHNNQEYTDRDGKKLQLQTLEWYQKQFDIVAGQVKVAYEQLQAAARRDQEATAMLIGPKGLHARIAFERVKQDRVKKEYGETLPVLRETQVEYQKFKDLRLRLDQREKELSSKSGKQ